MRAAIATTGDSPDDRVCKQFARCHGVVIVDSNDGRIERLPWASSGQPHGTAQTLISELSARQVSVVLAGHFCPRNRRLLEQAGIRCAHVAGRLRSVVARWRNGALG